MASKEEVIAALRARMSDPTISSEVFEELQRRVEVMEQ